MSKNHLNPWLLLLGLLSSTWAVQSAVVRFEQADYFALSNEPLTIRLIFDADESMAGDQLPGQGFFSVGAAIRFPPGAASTHEEAVQLPIPLDSDGLGNPPLKEATESRAGAAGAVDVLSGGFPHTNSWFLSITLTNLAGSGSYTLDSELFLAAPFNNFVSGAGDRLDSGISQFGSATVHVLAGIPEPAITSLTPSPTNQWNLHFTDPNGVPAVYEIQRAKNLNTPIVWEPVPQVTLKEKSPGVFEGIFADTAPQGYYRIKTRYPMMP